jgi:hypothetical protein
MRTELAALQMSLEALLEHRAALRKDYVDRDKELGREIKEILARIRELEESQGAIAVHKSETPEVTQEDLPVSDKGSRARGRYDYQTEVIPAVISLLQENGKMKGADIMRQLKERHNMVFSNPTITMNKIMSICPRIKKVDKYFQLV